MVVTPLDLGIVSVIRHDLTASPDGSLACSCGFRAGAEVWGQNEARRVAYAHLAAPERPTETLLAWVSGRTTAEQAEYKGLLRRLTELIGLSKVAGKRLADLADEHDSGTIALAVDLQDLASRCSL